MEEASAEAVTESEKSLAGAPAEAVTESGENLEGAPAEAVTESEKSLERASAEAVTKQIEVDCPGFRPQEERGEEHGMPKVSILMPVYNVEPYLEESMESVTRQTLRDIEIICINDGSTDASLAILKKYQKDDSRIIIIDKENGGYGMAMNIGLERASGEYIGIVEPDDFVPLDMFEDLYETAKKYDLDFVKADFYRFTRDEKTGDMDLFYNHLSKDPDDYRVIFDPSMTPRAISFIMNTWCGIYRREFLNSHHIRHNETPGASFQDNGFFFQTFVYAKRAMLLDHPYYMNRRDNPNSSVRNSQKVYCMNEEYDYIRGLLTKEPELWERFKFAYWQKRFGNYETTLRRIAPEFRKEYVKRMHSELKEAEKNRELSKHAFGEGQWNALQFVLKDPRGYYMTKLSDSQKELHDIKGSTSYRLGFALTSVPRKMKKALKDMVR